MGGPFIVSDYISLFGGLFGGYVTPYIIDKPWFINPGLTLARLMFLHPELKHGWKIPQKSKASVSIIFPPGNYDLGEVLAIFSDTHT